MADYSYLSKPPMWSYLRYVRDGDRMTDEMLLAAVETLQPPLLSDADMLMLAKELGGGEQRRGRPKGDILPRKRLAKLIAAIKRRDLPPEIQQLLIERLKSGRRFTEGDRGLPFYRASKRAQKHLFIRGIYRDVYALLDRKPPSIRHHILGEIAVPSDWQSLPRHERALEITAMLLRERLRLAPPSTATLRNLVREKVKLKS
jgi:hypothetical protein